MNFCSVKSFLIFPNSNVDCIVAVNSKPEAVWPPVFPPSGMREFFLSFQPESVRFFVNFWSSKMKIFFHDFIFSLTNIHSFSFLHDWRVKKKENWKRSNFGKWNLDLCVSVVMEACSGELIVRVAYWAPNCTTSGSTAFLFSDPKMDLSTMKSSSPQIFRTNEDLNRNSNILKHPMNKISYSKCDF